MTTKIEITKNGIWLMKENLEEKDHFLTWYEIEDLKHQAKSFKWNQTQVLGISGDDLRLTIQMKANPILLNGDNVE